MKQVNHFIVLFFIAFLVPQIPAYQERTFSYQRKMEFFSWQTFTFSTGNFDDVGSGFDRLPNGHKYQVFHVTPRLRYSLGNFGLRLGGRYGYAMSANLTDQRTNGQLDFVMAGADYVFDLTSGKVILFLDQELPIFKNNLTQDIVAVGDGVAKTQLGSEARFSLLGLASRIMLAYQARQELSDLVRWQADVEWRGWLAGLDGLFTVREQVGSFQAIKNWHCLANGCSMSFYAYNPNLMELYLGYRSPSWGVTLRHGVMGKNAAYETQVGFVLYFGSGKTQRSRESTEFVEDSILNSEEGQFARPRPRVINPHRRQDESKVKRVKKRKSPQEKLDALEQQLEQRPSTSPDSKENLDESEDEGDE